MLTEFEVRRRLSEIYATDLAPAVQARQILRLGKVVRKQSQELARSGSLLASADHGAAVQLMRLAVSARDLHEELRREASRLMSRRPLVLTPA